MFKRFLETDDYISCNDTIVINEMDICSGITRADIVVVNGKMHGYEIKSAQDNLSRLPQQMQSYNRVFDTMTIVTFETHINHITSLVPSWWGLLCVSIRNGEIVMETVRCGSTNNGIDHRSLAQLLWREEMLELLSNHAKVKRGHKNKSRFELSSMISEFVDKTFIEDYVRISLKSRATWRAVPLQQLYDDLYSR